jgi:hypothetical protein
MQWLYYAGLVVAIVVLLNIVLVIYLALANRSTE